jgi:plastocyanin
MLNKKTVAVALFGMLVPAMASAGDLTLTQSDKSFKLNDNKVETLSINAGDTIHFKNEDPFFHNIFSLSDLKTFDLGSYPAGESKSVTFDEPGEAEVECAIHPEMLIVIEVK